MLAAVLTMVLGLAAVTPEPAPKCGCSEALEFLSAKVARNYAGFEDKVTPERKPEYDALLAGLKERAKTAAAGPDCEKLLKEWVAFFKDNHMQVALQQAALQAGGQAPAGEEDPAAIRARFEGWEKIEMTEEAVRGTLAERRASLDPLEGIWQFSGSSYKVAIVRSPKPDRDFAAVILAADGVWWTPGQVKAVYKAAGPGQYESRIYFKDHSEWSFPARLDRNLLFHKGGPLLVKVYPETPGAVDLAAYKESLNTEVRFKELDPQTLLLQLPSFMPANAPAIEAAIRDNREKILKTPNLIIDLRGNPGGADFTFEPVIPFLYRQPVQVYGFDLYATEDNARYYDELSADPDRPEEQKEKYRKTAAELRANLGKFIPGVDTTVELEIVYPNPKRVALLVDRGCASSCEGFVDFVRQSGKAKVYGSNTGGAFDYGNIHVVRTPCEDYGMAYGTARKRGRQGSVDLTGFAPDVRIPEGELFPVDWVRRALAGEASEAP